MMKNINSKVSLLAGSALLALLATAPASASATFYGDGDTATDGLLSIVQLGVNGTQINNANSSASGVQVNVGANANLVNNAGINLGVGASTVETTYTTPPSQVISSSSVPSATITVGANLLDTTVGTSLSAELGTLKLAGDLTTAQITNLTNDTVTITANNLVSGASATTYTSAATGSITSLGVNDSLGLLSVVGSGTLNATAYTNPNTDLDVGINPGDLVTAINTDILATSTNPLIGTLISGIDSTLASILDSVGTVDILNLVMNEESTTIGGAGGTNTANSNALDVSVVPGVSGNTFGITADELVVAHSDAGVTAGDPSPVTTPEPSGIVVVGMATVFVVGLMFFRRKSTLRFQ